uniref:Uncharacterized protein n=1 Tax=Siphoviridae sp. ctYh54 TaxID=2826379 RepID=A0A8S5MEB9_9CAUD|nr:MAG TPA: hypothetical protein [Siphoviridae sp. ctYh54]
MSVESYLDSIRKNTIKNSEKTSNLNNTMKDLLNYESLKKAVSAGVESGNKEQFKRLAELSKKILTNSDATTAELKETNQLLKLFYAQIPKNSSGSTAVSADSWVKALKEVLDEFGNSLPEKFQKRLKYDIVSSAAEAGANPKLVMQQLNMTQVNQTMVVQNIFDYMKDKDKKLERDAEARKPIENNEKKEQSNFWQTRLGKVIDYLGGILKSLTGVAKWAGIIAVGVAVWSQLKESLRNALQGISGLTLSLKGGISLSKFLPKGTIGKLKSSIVDGIKKSFSKVSDFLKNSVQSSKIAQSLPKRTSADVFNAQGKLIGTTDVKMIGTSAKGFANARNVTPTAMSKLGGFFKSLSKAAPFIGKALKLFGTIFTFGTGNLLVKLLPFVSKTLPFLLRAVGKIAWPLQVVASVYDFIEGFINTKGSASDKIIGGIQNVIFKFFKSIWDLFLQIPKWLLSAAKTYITFVIKMNIRVWSNIAKMISNTFKFITSPNQWKPVFNTVVEAMKSFGKNLKTSFLNGVAEMVDDILTESDMPDWLKNALVKLREKLPHSTKGSSAPASSSSSSSSLLNFDFSASVDMPSSGGGIYEPATNTVYTGRDALSAAMPLESHVTGRTPANASGINKGYGVKLSSQTADFIKRAGITERITSGMEGAHKGTKYSPRTHASGNKFDMDISTSSVTRFANTVEKLLRTPGIKEIRTERVPNWVVEGGRKLLERKGYKTRGILFNDGYPNYATGPHLDVLIDPRYSGVKGSTRNLASTQGAIDKAGDFGVQTQKASNPLVASMQAQIAKAYNEAVKSFGVKSPNQLVANQSKANTSAITAQLANKASGNAVTFSKKNDISDTNLALLRLVDIV